MSENKIIFAGSLGVGVSTAIKVISDIAPTTREEKVHDSDTTVELDYGILKLDTGDQIHLYGTHDKETVQSLPEILGKNCIGMVLLINNTDAEPIERMLESIDYFNELVGKEAIAVGLTHYDNTPTPNINEFHVALKAANLLIPVFAVDVHERHDIITLIKALLYNLDSGVK